MPHTIPFAADVPVEDPFCCSTTMFNRFKDKNIFMVIN